MNSAYFVSRRRFLAMGAVSVAGLAAGSKRANARAATDDAVRVGVIGLGGRGMELLDDLGGRHTGGRVRVAAVCDVCAPRLRRGGVASGASAFRDWEALVGHKALDAVVIATPNHWHGRMAVAALEAGKHVYLEAPMTRTLAEAKAVRDTARRTGRCVQVGAQETSEGQWHAAGALVRSGQIGKIHWCQASERLSEHGRPVGADSAGIRSQDVDWDRWLGPAPKRTFDARRFLGWRHYWDYSGGVAANDFFHKLAPLLISIGSEFPERVSAAGGVYVNDGREAPDSLVMTAEYANGHTIVLATSPAHAQGMPAVIRGSYATVHFDRGKVNVASERGADGIGRLCGDSVWDEARIPARPSHMDNWLDAIRSGGVCVCDAELGYRSMAAVAMAVEAYRGRKTVYWDASTETAAPGETRV